jgi:hypothetical protein
MRKLILTALTAALVLSVAASLASARTGLASSPATNTLTLTNLELEGGLGNPVRCNVTMNVTLHSSVAKTVGALAGLARITVSTGSCAAGNAGLLVGGVRVTGAQGPYHVQYASFAGTLPSITAVTLNVVGVSFWIRSPEGVECNASNVSIHGSTTGGNPATGMRVEAQNIPLSGGFLCSFASGTMQGNGTLASRETITLI